MQDMNVTLSNIWKFTISHFLKPIMTYLITTYFVSTWQHGYVV